MIPSKTIRNKMKEIEENEEKDEEEDDFSFDVEEEEVKKRLKSLGYLD